MKKILLSYFVLTVVSLNGQISVNEGFESTSFPPAGWSYPTASPFSRTITSGYPCTGTAAVWRKLNGTLASTTTSYLMYSSTTSNGNDISVRFNYSAKKSNGIYQTYGNMLVEYSADAGTTWNTLGNQADFIADTNCTSFNASIPSGAVPMSSNFRLRITGTKTTPPTGTSDWYLTVDDVVMTQTATCFMPNTITATAITTNSATINWVSPTVTPANGYDYYYSLDPTTPLSTTTPLGSSSSTTANIGSLQPSSTYNVWVRSVCSSTDKSPWSAVGYFATECAPIASMFENFESYSTGNIVPKCWNRLVGSTPGAQNISNSNTFSGIRSITQTSSSAAAYSIAILPEFSNVNAGSNQLRFKAKVTTATGSLDVGYVTDPNLATSFVNIQTITPDTNYSEYIIPIPATIPANARLAIRNIGTTTRSHFWDDIYWESASGNLSTNETLVHNNTIKVYPNPFKDFISIANVKDLEVITISSISGQTLKVIKDVKNNINLSDLKAGVYLLTAKYKNGKYQSLKIVKN